MNRVARVLVVAASFAAIAQIAAAQAPVVIPPEAPVIGAIRNLFQKESPRISNIAFLDLLPLFGPPLRYAVIANGIRADQKFEGSFRDELFGVFVVDETFSRVLTVLDVLPTPRWNDYEMHFRKPSNVSLIVDGKGETYSDATMTKTYQIPRP
jgi:hypothetical protein